MPLRLEDPVYNQLVSFATVWAAVLCSLIASVTLLRGLLRIVFAVPLGLLSVGYVGALSLSTIAGGPLTGYEVLSRVEFPHSAVVAYRTNGGATTDFGVRVWHTMRLVPGVILARQLHSGYHEYAASLEIIAPHSVRATINGGRPPNDYVKEYRLRRFVVL